MIEVKNLSKTYQGECALRDVSFKLQNGRIYGILGVEGAGKSTQLALLKDYLEKQGRPVIVTREPGGTPLAENFRGIVKHYQGEEPLYAETELLLFAAARAMLETMTFGMRAIPASAIIAWKPENI